MASEIPPRSVLPPPSVPGAATGIPSEGIQDAARTGQPIADILTNGATTTDAKSPPYVGEALDDSERLLKYAAEIGVEIDVEIRDNILHARTMGVGRWNEKVVSNLLGGLTKLAAQLKPVTAQSLEASYTVVGSRPAFRAYLIVSIILAIFIVFFSLATFVTTAISKSISTDIVTANELAAKLRVQLGPPPDTLSNATMPLARDLSQPPAGLSPIDVITELQQYASSVRAIDARARQLNWLVFPHQSEFHLDTLTNAALIHAAFQLPVGLTNLWAAEEKETTIYQHVRSFAQSVLDNVSLIYGAISACLLPTLYALFGACAYLLRNFEQQMVSRTFIPSPANSARFLIAAIGGVVVGLFNFTITQGASIPPLAIAFLVGYAVDVFFAFLESLLKGFTKKAVSP